MTGPAKETPGSLTHCCSERRVSRGGRDREETESEREEKKGGREGGRIDSGGGDYSVNIHCNECQMQERGRISGAAER